jgi:hypothetical protein
MKTFVYAAVAATIAASSASANSVAYNGSSITDGVAETHWTGDASGLVESCQFRNNTAGVMGFDNTNKWTTSVAATLTVVQRGAVAVVVQPEQYIYETNGNNSIADFDDGIAHAVNVAYEGEVDSLVTTISQNDLEPGQSGNTDETVLTAEVKFAAGDSEGSSFIQGVAGAGITSSKLAEMVIADATFTSAGQGLTGGFPADELPRIMDLEIRGTATLVDNADLVLVDNKSYALQHNVTCLQ